MTLKGTSSLHRTTYFHLCFHDNTLIFRKQLISLGSGIIEFAGVMGAEKVDNYRESMVLALDLDEKMDNYPESMLWKPSKTKKQGPPLN